MNGVVVRKAKLVSDDPRRSIFEIMNGEISIKNLKVLKIKKGRLVLGNHWHTYPEVMFILKGWGHYHMKNIDTNEEEEFDLKEGDVVFRTGRIVHAGYFEEDSIIIDAASESYISADFNDVRQEIMK